MQVTINVLPPPFLFDKKTYVFFRGMYDITQNKGIHIIHIHSALTLGLMFHDFMMNVFTSN